MTRRQRAQTCAASQEHQRTDASLETVQQAHMRPSLHERNRRRPATSEARRSRAGRALLGWSCAGFVMVAVLSGSGPTGGVAARIGRDGRCARARISADQSRGHRLLPCDRPEFEGDAAVHPRVLLRATVDSDDGALICRCRCEASAMPLSVCVRAVEVPLGFARRARLSSALNTCSDGSPCHRSGHLGGACSALRPRELFVQRGHPQLEPASARGAAPGQWTLFEHMFVFQGIPARLGS